MEQLEKRFYPREELAEIAGLDVHGHNFSAQMKRCLTKWGYEYNFFPREGFEITRIPETPEEKLIELLRRAFHLDTQINPFTFSCFISAFYIIDGFGAMPWEKREKLFYEYFEISVTSRTMMNWRDHLCDAKVARRSRKEALWHTYTKDGRKIQEPADPESPEYREYCNRRSDLLEQMDENVAIPKRERWSRMIKTLYEEYGVYYYCEGIMFVAWGAEVQAIHDLTYEIMIQTG